MSDWTDSIVGERMAVDQEFSARVRESEFSSQEWSLIMTAVEFEIEHPDDPDRARIVADTAKVEGIMPELEKVGEGHGGPMGGPGGAPGGPGGGGSDGGGIFDGVKSALGLGGGDDDGIDQDRVDAAATLTQEYARHLQSHLQERGRWEEVCTVAAAGEGATSDEGVSDDGGETDPVATDDDSGKAGSEDDDSEVDDAGSEVDDGNPDDE